MPPVRSERVASPARFGDAFLKARAAGERKAKPATLARIL